MSTCDESIQCQDRNCGQNALGICSIVWPTMRMSCLYVCAYLCVFMKSWMYIEPPSIVRVAWNSADVGHAFICNIWHPLMTNIKWTHTRRRDGTMTTARFIFGYHHSTWTVDTLHGGVLTAEGPRGCWDFVIIGDDLVSELSVAGSRGFWLQPLQLPVKNTRTQPSGGWICIVNQYKSSITAGWCFSRSCGSWSIFSPANQAGYQIINKFPGQIKDQRNRTFVALSVLTTTIAPIYRSWAPDGITMHYLNNFVTRPSERNLVSWMNGRSRHKSYLQWTSSPVR